MIDIKLLASAHERVTYQLERANVHIDGVGNEHIAVLLDAAKVYQSAVASKDEVEAARAVLWADDTNLLVNYESIRAALTAAKIHAAHRVSTYMMDGFDGGYEAGWDEAIETCALVHDRYAQSFDDAMGKCLKLGLNSIFDVNFERKEMLGKLAQEIRALKPTGE